ncbi:phage tail tape measure protein [Hymenobacter sp. BT190]|uniref:phage tail tape measure protein n=1 Tax=Hymenobacter sp. BT190 TaxID=2763505 RepID=UPI00165194D4|nr:phage tail tape measure protein [Hymenobacter sp. BT190]MBC6698092.1 phage tail tape measure protein [Hymenobacter sp. BT190]
MSVRKDEVQVSVIVDGKQGINELGRLEMEAAELRQQMKGLKRDSEEFAQASEKYAQVKQRTRELREELGVTGMTMRQLRTYSNELKREMDNLTAGTPEWERLNGKLQEVNGTMGKQKEQMQGLSKFWEQIKGEVKSFGMLAVGFLGFQFLSQEIGNVISKNAKLSDSFSDIQKTTGMTAGEVRALNKDLSQVNTRTKGDELRKIAADAGQLGIAKNDILAFTVATDKLYVALGDEFGSVEEVTKQTGALRNIFSDIKSQKVDEDMLHIGNAINVLGSEGAATGPVIADFANRIGGVGISMGLTSGQVLGLSATMQELNINAERGGTATVKILQGMASEPAKFARVAGMEAAKFKKLVDTDLYGALVKVMEGTKQSGASATALAGILNDLGVDGAGASEVMAKLGSNTDMLQAKVKRASGALSETSSIMGEFDTKNNNFAAKLERIGKALNSSFVNSAIMDGLEGIVDGLDSMIGKSDEVEQLTLSFERQKQAVADLAKNTEPLIDRYEQLKGKTSLNKTEQAELDTIVGKLADTIPSAVTEWDKYGKALGINSGLAREFLAEQKALLRVMNEDAIEGAETKLTRIQGKIINATRELNQKDEQGRTGYRQEVNEDGSTSYYRRSTGEIALMRAALKRLQEDEVAARGILANLKGEKTPEQIKSEMDAKWLAYVFGDQKGLKAVEEQHLGLLQEIDEKIKRLTEQQLATRSKAEILQLKKQIEEQQNYRLRLLGEFRDKEAEKDAAQLEKDKAAALKNFRALQEVAMQEQAKLRATDADADQQAINQLEAHYETLMQRATEFAASTLLSEAEHRAALATVNLLADTRDEARDNLKKQQAEKRAAEALKFEYDHEMARVNLRILLAKRNQKNDPQELEDAMVEKVEKQRDFELKNTKLTEEQKQLIIRESEDAIAAIRANGADRALEKLQETVREFAGYMQDAAQTMAAYMKQQNENELKRLQEGQNKRLRSLDQENKAGLMGKAEYETRKLNLEEQFEQNSANIKRRQAERDKEFQMFEAITRTAVAVVEGLIQGGPALAAFYGLLGGIQIATIASAEIPAFAEGGFTAAEVAGMEHVNLSRSTGGMLPNSGPFLATVNEVGAEYFVPHNLLSQPVVANHVAAIEAIRTGAMPAFAQGGFSATPPPSYSAPTSSAPTGMSEATAQQMLAEFTTLRQLWQAGAVVRAEVVPEALAKTTQTNTSIYQDSSV